jgi:nitrilase
MADDRRFVRSEKTAEKACDLIAEAAKGGAELVVFSGIVPAGIPDLGGVAGADLYHGFFRALVAQAQI